jgi:uncharacterized protein
MKMRIDTHLHVMLKPFYGRPPTDPEQLLADLSAAGFDGGWVSSVDAMVTSELSIQQSTHDALAELVRAYPGKIEGFCTVTPAAGDAAAKEIVRAKKELGLVGVKLHPWLQAFSVSHPGMPAIMETAGALGMPVLFHDGTPPYATPTQIAWLAGKYPQTQVVLGHSGLADLWRDAAAAAQEHPNIWLQPSAAPPQTIRAAHAGAGADRLLFGSDGGFGTVGFIRYCVNKFRAAVGENVFDKATITNPARVLETANTRPV